MSDDSEYKFQNKNEKTFAARNILLHYLKKNRINRSKNLETIRKFQESVTELDIEAAEIRKNIKDKRYLLNL